MIIQVKCDCPGQSPLKQWAFRRVAACTLPGRGCSVLNELRICGVANAARQRVHSRTQLRSAAMARRRRRDGSAGRARSRSLWVVARPGWKATPPVAGALTRVQAQRHRPSTIRQRLWVRGARSRRQPRPSACPSTIRPSRTPLRPREKNRAAPSAIFFQKTEKRSRPETGNGLAAQGTRRGVSSQPRHVCYCGQLGSGCLG
jgi:hypothetical protein